MRQDICIENAGERKAVNGKEDDEQQVGDGHDEISDDHRIPGCSETQQKRGKDGGAGDKRYAAGEQSNHRFELGLAEYPDGNRSCRIIEQDPEQNPADDGDAERRDNRPFEFGSVFILVQGDKPHAGDIEADLREFHTDLESGQSEGIEAECMGAQVPCHKDVDQKDNAPVYKASQQRKTGPSGDLEHVTVLLLLGFVHNQSAFSEETSEHTGRCID